ncbi:DNRLRE domain-containing protein [Streptosporangium sp. NBC_01495]|uniref:DNRLRE domain-containing protein n=1 Tax=Streptosporangium sp. NBC_01495 TaxID=2903899 RepID=UPI002E3551EC|nr:DNRLRE domain-containing protein [Streptosporangium sp. NBC_01495]
MTPSRKRWSTGAAILAVAVMTGGAFGPAAVAEPLHPSTAGKPEPQTTVPEQPSAQAPEQATGAAPLTPTPEPAMPESATPAAGTSEPEPAGPTPEELRALGQARETGRQVEVVERRTETSDITANPNGTLTLRQHLRPVRAQADGRWRPVDPTLRRRADGTVAPRSTTFGMAFSGGGTGPLATLVKGGRSLTLTWPEPLPAPAVSGSEMTYPEVLPGVDLKILVEADNFVSHLIVKNARAAADPRLRTLTFRVGGKGLRLATDSQGGLTATDDTGGQVFTAPRPLMWDSSANSGAGLRQGNARSAKPAETGPARTAQMTAEVGGGRLRIVPDRAMLDDPATVYPVTIDPIFNDGYKNHWSVAYKQAGSPSIADTAFYDGTKKIGTESPVEARVGYEDWTGGTARSYFQMNTDDLRGSRIVAATFNVLNTYSYSCTKMPVQLGWTGGIGSGTTWNNQPTWKATLQTKSYAHGWSTSCAGGGEDYAAVALREAVQENADLGGTQITLGLRAEPGTEDDPRSWKRFRVNATNPVLEVTYNNMPKVNSKAAYLGTWGNNANDVPIRCDNNPATWPVVGNTGIALTAKVSDPDDHDVTAKFLVWQVGGNNVATPSDKVSSGGTASVTVAAATFRDAVGYRWTVQATDGVDMTGGSGDCGFVFDKKAPTKPVVAATDGQPLDVATVPARARRTIKFTSTDTQLDGFCYALNHPLSIGGDRCSDGTWVDAVNGAATVNVVPPRWPNNRLHVVAYDVAGNVSPYSGASSDAETNTTLILTTAPQFVADPDGIAAGDRDGDLNGDGHPDFLAVAKDGRLLFYTGKGDGTIAWNRTFPSGWNDAKLAHRGDLIGPENGMGPDGYEDVFVLKSDRLWIYPGDGLGEPLLWGRRELKHPGGGNWAAATQVIAPGDIDGKLGVDLIVNEGGKLLLFSGTQAGPLATATNGELATPTVIGASGWADLDAIAPGEITPDANGDGAPDDGNAPDLITRSRSTGEMWIHPGVRAADGGYTLAPRRAYGLGGWTSAARPALTSNGNAQGTVATVDGAKRFQPTPGQETPDIWSTGTGGVDNTGVLYFSPGAPADRGAAIQIGDSYWVSNMAGIY